MYQVPGYVCAPEIFLSADTIAIRLQSTVFPPLLLPQFGPRAHTRAMAFILTVLAVMFIGFAKAGEIPLIALVACTDAVLSRSHWLAAVAAYRLPSYAMLEGM